MPYSVTAPDGRKIVVGDDGAPLQDTPSNRGLYGDLSQFGGGASYAAPGDTFDPSKSYHTAPGFATASIPTPSAPTPTYAVGGGNASFNGGGDGRAPAVRPLEDPNARQVGVPAMVAAPSVAQSVAPPAAPGAPASAAPATAGGVYAPPDYTGNDTGTYGQWLRELHGYAAPATGTVAAGASPTDQLNAMLAATHADHYLSPYYVAMLRSGVGKAGAGYALSAALQPGSPDMPNQTGTGASESMAQYMQDQLLQRGNQGIGTSGWGPYASGVPLMGQFVSALTNAENAPAGSPESSLWDKYNTTAGRQELQNILGAGVEGPFQAYRQGALNRDVFNPAATGTDNAAFVKQLHDWMHATYGV